jgi:hypothetical protein
VCVPSFLSCCFHWNFSLHILRFSFISLLKKLWNTLFIHFSKRSTFILFSYLSIYLTQCLLKFSPFPLLILLLSPDLYYQTTFSS